ncbi:MAG: Gfo/Idh/MocA family protein [Acidimicrobiales bacterium]
MSDPVRVGLVGAGPWASMVHAPVFAGAPETTLEAVWARRPETARTLAARHGATPVATTDELFQRCEAVVFAVPPDVQADLAVAAARAGCALVLEKPIAGDLAGAEALALAAGESGVASMVVLSWRYAAAVRAFLDDAAHFDAFGGSGQFLSSGLLGGPFATPWRLERGPLLDLGPHVVDLLDAALGPVTAVRATGHHHDLVTLQLEHRSGVVSTALLSATMAVEPHRAGVELYGSAGVLEIDCATAVGPEAFLTVARELAEAVRGTPHPLDVGRGLHLQRILADAEGQLIGFR